MSLVCFRSLVSSLTSYIFILGQTVGFQYFLELYESVGASSHSEACS